MRTDESSTSLVTPIVPEKQVSTPSPFKEGSDEGDYYKSRKILVVDDEKGVRQSLKLYLDKIGFQAEAAESAENAIERLEKGDYFLVLTDITMPGLGGLELLSYINNLNKEIDVVMITGHMDIDYAIKAIKEGAFDYFKKPFLFDDVRTTIMRVIEKQTLKRKTIELERIKEREQIEAKNVAEFMIALAKIIDAKSPYTLQHSDRVASYSIIIAQRIGLSAEQIQRIELGAKLHDIGKLGTPEYILDKKGPLTLDEYNIIKQHPSKGAEMLHPITSLQDLTDIIHFHHENIDGSGYPDGLQGDKIPLTARIVKIADYWDAITSHRPYRDPMSFQQASETMMSECDVTVDGEMLKQFLDCLSKKAL